MAKTFLPRHIGLLTICDVGRAANMELSLLYDWIERGKFPGPTIQHGIRRYYSEKQLPGLLTKIEAMPKTKRGRPKKLKMAV